jgi:hypothetical protein
MENIIWRALVRLTVDIVRILPPGCPLQTGLYAEWALPEPDKFIPERFLGRMNEEVAMQVDSVFGFSRRWISSKRFSSSFVSLYILMFSHRGCPGKWFADNNVWLLAGNIIAMFDIEKALDGSGNPITPPGDYTMGYVRYILFSFLCTR